VVRCCPLCVVEALRVVDTLVDVGWPELDGFDDAVDGVAGVPAFDIDPGVHELPELVPEFPPELVPELVPER
jgi:hypothetical protein